ncbi:MAG: hypothetical protein ABSG00_10755 [Terracidiphilus sp.]
MRVIAHNEPIGPFGRWIIYPGELKPRSGSPIQPKRLFTAVAEKLPKDSLVRVCNHLSEVLGHKLHGVYVAHDSMGYPRYIGRGDIKNRLLTRFKAKQEELHFFSFYVVLNKIHEREIETLLIHAAGPLLDFNRKKKRAGIQTGAIKDFETGTHFYFRSDTTKGKRNISAAKS